MRSSPSRVSLLAAAALCALAAGCSKPKPAPKAAPVAGVTVSTAVVQSRTLATSLSAPGLLVAREEAAVSTQLTGYRVAQVLVDQNDSVAAGQPVARLDDTLLRTQIAQQQAIVDQQKVAAERAGQEAQRVAGLDNAGVLSQEQIVERRLSARSANAAVAAAQAQLNDLSTREKLMVVRAPVGGRVLERTVRPGDVASPTQVMYRLSRGGVVELNAEVPESDLAQIRAGQRATVELPSGERVAGVVRLVSPTVDTASKLGHARITLPPRADLRIGGYGRAVFDGASRTAAAVPESAVIYDADGVTVMTIGADDRAHKVRVRTGVRSGGYIELLEGPPAGTRVALGGSSFVLEGDKVRTAPAAEGRAAAR